MCALLLNHPSMKKALLLLAMIIGTSVFADTGIATVRHYTVRTKTTVCAIDVVVMTNGHTKVEKSCFQKV